ncbi:hypothetical protein BN1080_01740 [Planococcus massiliensis]|uniref:Branched-chain amino acid ABC transporter substrate-binding protein n=1 Tax=Planococcus massiliensis TaxID=1499687 RepID=A0A098ELZ8_9BACL|nr:hypothetical protein [Planococcus massiliensis]CEG22805.1 hypothetical protein BN1080_01740 [Planococcus massiliensis]
MKKIKDERLILKNLQHIRIAYVVQTLGILLILGYELIQGGLEGMRENPIWLVFMLTTVVYAYVSMSTSVDHEREKRSPKKSLAIGLIVTITIAAGVVVLTAMTPGFAWADGFLIGGILCVCGLVPLVYIYRLRMKRTMELEE